MIIGQLDQTLSKLKGEVTVGSKAVNKPSHGSTKVKLKINRFKSQTAGGGGTDLTSQSKYVCNESWN